MSGGRGQLLRATIGIGISLVALALVIRQIDAASVAQVLSTAVPAWLGVMLLFQLIDIAVRGLRWERLLAPIHRVPYLRTLDYLLVGYLANNILPARLGELVRSHYLGDREGVSRTTTLGTVVVERVVDTTILVAIASLAILVLQVRGVVASAVLVVVGFRTLHLPPLPGYLIAGVAIGPHALGWVADAPATRQLAEFGVVFLMFSVGLEFSLPKLRVMRRAVFGLGLAQVTVTITTPSHRRLRRAARTHR